MKILSINQLLCLTRFELLELQRHLICQLADLPAGSIERAEASGTLANIRLVLARPEFVRRRDAAKAPWP